MRVLADGQLKPCTSFAKFALGEVCARQPHDGLLKSRIQFHTRHKIAYGIRPAVLRGSVFAEHERDQIKVGLGSQQRCEQSVRTIQAPGGSEVFGAQNGFENSQAVLGIRKVLLILGDRGGRVRDVTKRPELFNRFGRERGSGLRRSRLARVPALDIEKLLVERSGISAVLAVNVVLFGWVLRNITKFGAGCSNVLVARSSD